MAGVIINADIVEIKDTFAFSTCKLSHPLLVIDFTSPQTEVMTMNNAFACLPGESIFKDITFARVYGGLPEVMLAAGVEAEPTYKFYLNGILFDEWKLYGRGPAHEHITELHRRVTSLLNASDTCNREDNAEAAAGLVIQPHQMEVFQRDFDAVDADGSGFIESREVSYLLKIQLGRKATDEEVMSVMRSFDKDENGYIDFEEYMTWMLGEGWSCAQSEVETMGPDCWVFRYASKKSGKHELSLFADRMVVYQRTPPAAKGQPAVASRRIGFIQPESQVALVPNWTHVADGIDSKMPMRASCRELNAQPMEFRLESTNDLLTFARPQSISIVDFTTNQKIKLKGTKMAYNAVRKVLLKKK